MAQTGLDKAKISLRSFGRNTKRVGAEVGKQYRTGVDNSQQFMPMLSFILIQLVVLPFLPAPIGLIFFLSWLAKTILAPIISLCFGDSPSKYKAKQPSITYANGLPKFKYDYKRFNNRASLVLSTVGSHAFFLFQPAMISLHYLLNALALPYYTYKSVQAIRHPEQAQASYGGAQTHNGATFYPGYGPSQNPSRDYNNSSSYSFVRVSSTSNTTPSTSSRFGQRLNAGTQQDDSDPKDSWGKGYTLSGKKPSKGSQGTAQPIDRAEFRRRQVARFSNLQPTQSAEATTSTTPASSEVSDSPRTSRRR